MNSPTQSRIGYTDQDEIAAEQTPPERGLFRGLGHIELFDFADEDLDRLEDTLAQLSSEGYRTFSFRAPMPRPGFFPWHGDTCFLLNPDRANRELYARLLQETLEQAREWGAGYAVTPLTHAATDTDDPELAADLARGAAKRLALFSRDFGVPVDIAYNAYSPAFNRAGQFAELIARHPELGISLDVGDAYLGAVQNERDYLSDIEELAPLTRSLRLWNTRGPEHYAEHGRRPLHPSQSPDEGWIDIRRVLEIVLEQNPAVTVVFGYADEDPGERTRIGYDWVAQAANAIVRNMERARSA